MSKKAKDKLEAPRARQHSTTVEWVAIDSLVPIENPRHHPEREILSIMEAIKQFGYTDPIHISKLDNTLLEGYARVEACRRLNWPEVPALRLDVKSEEYRAVMILGNRLQELGSWDYPMLIRFVEEMQISETPIPDFETAVGFTPEEMANMKNWQESLTTATPTLSDLGAVAASPRQQEREEEDEDDLVDITITFRKSAWEAHRVEIESDLGSMVMKYEKMKVHTPKAKKGKFE